MCLEISIPPLLELIHIPCFFFCTGRNSSKRTDPIGYQGLLPGLVDEPAVATADSVHLPVLLFVA